MRKYYSSLRKNLNEKRREEAALFIQKTLLCKPKRSVLSYWPIGSELNLRPLNQILASQNRLFLPSIEKNGLVAYQVDHPEIQLKLSHMRLWEPDPLQCPKVPWEIIDCILVPGLAFDREHYRLGYGEGWYDRLLKNSIHTHTIGIGYLEQLSSDLLPHDPWDMPLSEILLG